MAKKFKIKQNPTFKTNVNIPIVGDETVSVGFEFKYMSRKELAKLYDTWHEKAIKLSESIKGEEVTLTQMTDAEIEIQVQQIKDIVVGWDIEDKFNDENIENLVDISVNIVSAITGAYNKAYTEVKLGN